jgi:hypothetical protein
MKRMLAGLTLLTLAATAQRRPVVGGQPVPLRGQVVEAGTDRPIVGVEVKVSGQSELDKKYNLRGRPHPPVRTGLDGSFSFFVDAPGEYDVEAQHPDYGPAGPAADGYTAGAHLELQRGQRSGEIRIELARPGTFTGRVVDRETRKPLAGFAVLALARTRRVAFDVEIPIDRASTNADGRFRMAGLPPGPYRIRIDAPPGERSEIIPGRVNLDEEQPSTGYCELWWPAMDRRDQAAIQTLGTGQEMDLGEIPVDRCKAHTVAVRVLASGCAPGVPMDVTFERVNGERRASAVLACGESFFLRGVVEGEYNLYATVKPGLRNRRLLGQARLTVADRLQTDLVVSPGLKVCGRINREGREARIDIRGTPDRQPDKLPAQVDAEGAFCDDAVPPGLLRLRVLGLPKGTYLRDIEYNGGRVSPFWTPFPAAPHHTLILTVASGLARLEGTVTDGKKGQPDVRLFLTPWPVGPDEFRQQCRSALTSASGTYAFEDVAPGEYRLVAATADLTGFWTTVELLTRFQPAKTMQVGSGESKTLDISSWAQ